MRQKTVALRVSIMIYRSNEKKFYVEFSRINRFEIYALQWKLYDENNTQVKIPLYLLCHWPISILLDILYFYRQRHSDAGFRRPMIGVLFSLLYVTPRQL